MAYTMPDTHAIGEINLDDYDMDEVLEYLSYTYVLNNKLSSTTVVRLVHALREARYWGWRYQIVCFGLGIVVGIILRTWVGG